MVQIKDCSTKSIANCTVWYANLPIHLVVWKIVTFVHPEGLRDGADVVRHEVVLLQLVVEVGQVPVSLPGHQTALVGLVDVTSLSEQSRPQLDADNPEDEEDEEAEEEDVTKHGQRVQQQHDQDPHAWQGPVVSVRKLKLKTVLTWNPVNGPERPEDPDCPYSGEVEFLHVQAILEGTTTHCQAGQSKTKTKTIPSLS